jgi:hypothetical protein
MKNKSFYAVKATCFHVNDIHTVLKGNENKLNFKLPIEENQPSTNPPYKRAPPKRSPHTALFVTTGLLHNNKQLIWVS